MTDNTAALADGLEPCPSCGALPCDWVDNPHQAAAATRIAQLEADRAVSQKA